MCGDRFFLLAAQAVQPLCRFLQRGWRVRAVDADARSGLVDEVDRLVGKEAVRHVAGCQFGGRFKGLVTDRQAVVFFVAGAHALEDIDRVFNPRFVDGDRL